TRLNRGSTQPLCSGGMVQDVAVASAYARRCWIWARTPVRASGKVAYDVVPSVAPRPEKLFASGGTRPPNENQPVSMIDCMNAMSPRTPSAWPSFRYMVTSSSMGTDARYAGRSYAFHQSTICSTDTCEHGPITWTPPQ